MFNNFNFKNKSENLRQLMGQINLSIILDQKVIPLSRWRNEQNIVYEEIKSFFPNSKLIIRSSHGLEDRKGESLAGHFQSIGKISRNKESIIESVNSVFQSYQKSKLTLPIDPILFIQPYIDNLKTSGVALSFDLTTGSPYVCINRTSRGTSTPLTSGRTKTNRIDYVHRSLELEDLSEGEIKNLYAATKEIENITASTAIEIEFGICEKNNLYLFQVRPLNFRENRMAPQIVTLERIEYLQDRFKTLKSKRPEIPIILSDMADWNPAEMIGDNPKPLTRSLYFSIIDSQAWSNSRENLGYKSLPHSSTKLFTILGNHPYVNVINSLQSFSPKGLKNKTSLKLLRSAVNNLNEKPELHDKVEFEVFYTCYSPTLESRLRNDPFLDHEEEVEIISLMKNLTLEIINGSQKLFSKSKADFLELENIYQASKSLSPEESIKLLHVTAKEKGALTFATLARLGFIANIFLKELKEKNPSLIGDIEIFLESIETITTEFKKSYQNFDLAENGDSTFLSVFGHLRPGTYNIEVPCYREEPHRYFKSIETENDSINIKESAIIEKLQHINIDDLRVSQELINALTLEKNTLGLNKPVESLIEFIVQSIRYREYAKFILSKNISELLSSVKEWSKQNCIKERNMPFLSIEYIMEVIEQNKTNQEIQKQAEKQRELYNSNSNILLPPLISKESDFLFFSLKEAKPTFITNTTVFGETILLGTSELQNNINLNNKVVIISYADPGYDWIFNFNIKGLITQYGGMGSHMAIRCSEQRIPAAIGCGEVIFKRVLEYKSVTIDCKEGVLF